MYFKCLFFIFYHEKLERRGNQDKIKNINQLIWLQASMETSCEPLDPINRDYLTFFCIKIHHIHPKITNSILIVNNSCLRCDFEYSWKHSEDQRCSYKHMVQMF